MRIDWTTTDGCPRCNEHGPYEQWDAKVIQSAERGRDLHQAWHVIAAEFVRPAVWLLRVLVRP